jgi:osmotically-inducible protein OsmY
METSLQRANLGVDEINASLETYQRVEEAEEAEHHIHMPGPSAWPFILSGAILAAVIGLLFIPDAPWLTLAAIPFIIYGIIGWALQDPERTAHDITTHRRVLSLPAQEVLNQARATTDRVVTISDTVFSSHPVKTEIEEETPEGVIIALYGKVELQSQRERLEEAIREVPGVVDVRNFVVAEDTILNEAYKRIDNMKAQNKLEGATNLSVLVENYILNLYGEVPTTSMKYALEREVLGIPGVRVVVNHIGLNKDIPGNLGKTRNN